jgi:hypothetical protein
MPLDRWAEGGCVLGSAWHGGQAERDEAEQVDAARERSHEGRCSHDGKITRSTCILRFGTSDK